ncbi:MAG: DNA primase [Balneolia bacterium]|nr:DNA primase [Balneolia bacterium]
MASSRITDSKKEEIRDAADIVDVVSDYVKLKKAGGGFTGLCPFHNEKSPSFHVTPRLGIFKCFGCGEGGDVFNFVMKMEGVGFVEAMRTVAERYNIELPKEEQDDEFDERTQLTEGIYHALRFAGQFYHEQLNAEDEAAEARNYLGKRGLKTKTIRKWGLGFAHDRMDHLYTSAIEQGINETYLFEAGLIKYSENSQKPYDYFRGRLMFPIFNPSGKVIGFGGRIMEGLKGPKYLNSPQTKVYNKSEVMYGIHLARNEIRKHDQSILVEGYMDVISLWQSGILNVVATSGTSVTPDQMRRLRNYSQNMLMVYDADNAGQNAMIRGLDVALQADMHVRLMHLPEGEDPDSFVQQFGADSFIEYTEKESKDFISFMIAHAEESGDWEDPMSRKNVVSRILSSIARVKDAVLRETLVDHLRRLSGVGERSLLGELSAHIQEQTRELERSRQREYRQQNRESQQTSDGNEEPPFPGDATKPQKSVQPAPSRLARTKKSPAEKEIIRLMIEHGDEMIYYVGQIITHDYFEDEGLRMFYNDIIQRYNDELPISIAEYTAQDPPFPELTGEIFIEQHSISEKGNERRTTRITRDADPFATARGALKAITRLYYTRRSDEIKRLIETSDDAQRRQLYSELMKITKDKMMLERTSADELFPSLEDLIKNEA